MRRRYAAINDIGCRIGEGHPRSTISDAEVDRIRELREDRGLSYGQIALMVERPVCTIAKICRYERRAQTAVRWIRI
jgi:ribosome-binding protein aMBF1 (putative translation factor)